MIEINMQMPEKCGLCPCFHFENPMYCQAVKADKNKKIVSPYGPPRPEWCPLKEQENSVPMEPLADWLSHYAAPPVRLGIDCTMEDLKKAWRATLEGIK